MKTDCGIFVESRQSRPSRARARKKLRAMSRGSGRRLRHLDVKLAYRHSGEMIPPLGARISPRDRPNVEPRWRGGPRLAGHCYPTGTVGRQRKAGPRVGNDPAGVHSCPRGNSGMRRIAPGTAHRVHLLRQPRYADPALEKRCAAGLIFRHAPIGVGLRRQPEGCWTHLPADLHRHLHQGQLCQALRPQDADHGGRSAQ